MARLSFASTNVIKKSNFDYPKFKLKKGETARISIQEDPNVEYVHTLRTPKIVNGVPQMHEAENRRQEKYKTHTMDFVSRPICLGDIEVLNEQGLDPKNCPVCAAHKEDPKSFDAPQRRFALHVVRYKTKPGSVNIAAPYSVDIEVWSFTDRIFAKLVEFKEEWDEQGGLLEHDIIVGPCENETFQKFDLRVSPTTAGYLKNDETAKFTKEALEANQIEDLSIACGMTKESRFLVQDIGSIKEKWAEVRAYEARENGEEQEVPAKASSTITEDLSSILDDEDEEETVKASPVKSEEPEEVDELSALIEGLED